MYRQNIFTFQTLKPQTPESRVLRNLELISIWKHMCKYTDFSDPSILKAVRPLVLEGIPNEVRSLVWLNFSTVNTYINFSHIGFEQEATDQVKSDIERDIMRTFVATIGNNAAQSKIPQLRRILESYSVVRPDISYIQGMNFIASMALLFADNEDIAFKIFYGILESPRLALHNCYQNSLPGCTEIGTAWLIHIEKRMPWLHEIFKESSDCPEMISMKNIQSLTISIDIPLALKTIFMDRFVAFGRMVVISFTSTMARIMKDQIMKDPALAVCQLMSTNLPEEFQDVDRFLEIWDDEWITEEEYLSLLQ